MKTNKIGIICAGIGMVLFASAASAAPAISIKSVEQRWPWNNKVDITYEVTGGQDVTKSQFYRIEFTTVIGDKTYTIDGNSIGASAADDTHTVTWTAPDGVRNANCTMSAALYEANVPSGNDYMIIDLTKNSDNVSFEGLLATQAESDARYIADIYKTEKLVLRKIPAGGPYYVTSTATKTTDRDYYVGIFPVTEGQYARVGGDRLRSDLVISVEKKWPMRWISCDDLRLSDTSTTSPIPKVSTGDTGTFFQRLNYKTGNRLSFDLPTLMMFAIAARAGVTTAYFWGSDTMDETKVVCSDNSNKEPKDVGSRPANNWGFFDVSGNVFEWGLDSNWGNSDFSSYPKFIKDTSVFVPKCDGSTTRTWMGGGSYNTASSANWFKLNYASFAVSEAGRDRGFRVSVVMD